MRNYNQQIEDAYARSKRQGDMMRDRNIERSSGQDRRNRYRDDRYQYPQQGRSFDEHNQYDDQRTDRYGYERSSLYNNEQRREHRSYENRNNYPETYRSAMGGYMSEHVGSERADYNRNFERGSLYGNNDGPHRGKGPKNYKRSDEKIREEIFDRLTDDPYVDASEIEVAVHTGEVTLLGLVNKRNAKRRAEDIAESVSGVTNVENRLKV
jgi:osmotically-inducible protein OsmY